MSKKTFSSHLLKNNRLKNFGFILAILTICVVFSCNNEEPTQNGDQIARVYDDYLYTSDIAGIVGETTSATDSIRVVDDFIENWIKRKLMLGIAERNIENLKSIEDQTREYRESLIIYEYEKQWINDRLDTLIDSKSINEYYDLNKDNFVLAGDIYNVAYAVMNIDAPLTDSIEIWMNRYDEDAVMKLNSSCYQFCLDYNSGDSTWYSRENLLKVLPADILEMDEMVAGSNHKIVDDTRIFLLRILGRKINGTQGPLSYFEGDIRSILLNKRKRDLIDNTYKDIYLDGGKRNSYEIFNK